MNSPMGCPLEHFSNVSEEPANIEIDLDMLGRSDPEGQKRILGEYLYPKVKNTLFELQIPNVMFGLYDWAGKITEMLLDVGWNKSDEFHDGFIDGILDLYENPEAMKEHVKQGVSKLIHFPQSSSITGAGPSNS